MALDTTALQGWVIARAVAATGIAADPLTYEPKGKIDYAAAAGGTVLACWLAGLSPARAGLAATGARVEWMIRLHRNAFEPDQGESERLILAAADALVESLFADIEDSVSGAWFDPRGQTGEPARLETGWLDIDKQLSRTASLTVAVVVDNAWTEAV